MYTHENQHQLRVFVADGVMQTRLIEQVEFQVQFSRVHRDNQDRHELREFGQCTDGCPSTPTSHSVICPYCCVLSYATLRSSYGVVGGRVGEPGVELVHGLVDRREDALPPCLKMAPGVRCKYLRMLEEPLCEQFAMSCIKPIYESLLRSERLSERSYFAVT